MRLTKVQLSWAQAKASAARASSSEEAVEETIWVPHHTWAGAELYRIAVDLRGFYLKVSHPELGTAHSSASGPLVRPS